MSRSDLIKEFEDPLSGFSPIPFWFWNDDLNEEEIKRQISEFYKKGVNGFVIHPRIGLPENIPYMSDAWLHYVSFAVKEAGRFDMQVILYDEAMYPSGSCHGEVVKTNPQYASKCLEMREENISDSGEKPVAQIEKDGRNYYLFECFSNGTIRGIHYGEDDGQPGAPRSADLLDFDAVKCFMELTHERYYQALSRHFGNTVTGIFTDEPMICGRGPQRVPWTTGFEKVLLQNGFPLQDLFYLFSKDDSKKAKSARKKYYDLIRKRLQESFYGQISDWCKNHGIAFIGHPEKSTDIGLLKHFDIPCQDIVWRYVAPKNGSALTGKHSTMAKCASDSARHRGKRRNGNECFGCCGHEDDPFAFTYEDMKWYLDWLFVRGCNLIIPHAFFYSLRGKRREERPPDVGMNSCFWDGYNKVSDYIKRCCAINTDSVNVTDVAILCDADDLPWRAAKILFENQIEFNYLEYDLIKDIEPDNGCLKIASNRYKILIKDGVTFDKADAALQKFIDSGGIVIDYDNSPDLAEMIRRHSKTLIDLHCVADLRITHIKKYDTDILFCVNEGEETVKTVIKEKVTAVLDAESGKIGEYRGDEYFLTLPPRKSIHLIIEK